MKIGKKNNKSFTDLLKKGDKVAYETLFRLYYDKLLHLSKGYVGKIEDAEEIVQNVFLKVWEQKNNFSKIHNINNYLYTMARNACLDHLKHVKVKKKYSENYYSEKIAIQYLFIKDETAASLLESELEKRITEGIEALPKKCRKIFIKSRVEGLKHGEIAEALGVSKRTVDNHISNALAHMKLHLKEFLTIFF